MAEQINLFGEELAERAILDQLLEDSRLYHRSENYLQLLDFVARLRNFAPFNAMLLHIQKPGLTYAASAHDWRERFGRSPRADARPLLILWPFGPVALVYDVMDTEGEALPADVQAFHARGSMTGERMGEFLRLLARRGIAHEYFDGGDARAGSIRLLPATTLKAGGGSAAGEEGSGKDTRARQYLMRLNLNHDPNVQFSTLAHEMGHLLLGHLGGDEKLRIASRRQAISVAQKELEAESFAYLMCRRQGVECNSAAYLASYVNRNPELGTLDVYQILKAVGKLETLLKLGEHTRFGARAPRRR